MQNKTLNGSLMVLGAAMLWGTTGTAQSLVPHQISAYWIGALRLAVSAAFFAVFVFGTEPRSRWQQDLRRLAWPEVVLAGACIAGYNLAFFAGVKANGVAIGTAIALGSGPIWAGVLQWLLTRHIPRPAWWLGTLLAVAGGTLMVLGGSADHAITLHGTLLCLAAGLGYAAYTVLNQRLVRVASPATVTLGVFSSAALVALPAARLLSGPLFASASDWLLVGYLGVVATGVSFLLFSHALRWLASATAVTLALAEPLVAFSLAVLVLHEQTTPNAWIGLGLVLAGLACVVGAEIRDSKRPASRSA
ncbi:DMT family transporter [Rhodoferax sp.]|uniref:DMT family transporter n=1 Tax=Rhodoferax sp. TaxID=50421 RepID=UPI00374D1038